MQGFLEKMGLEKSAELKEMESVHSRQSPPHQQRPWGDNEQHGLGLRSGRKWLREGRMRVGRAGGLRGTGRVTAPGR